MDEYLEWSTKKDERTKDVLLASFTCEGPEVRLNILNVPLISTDRFTTSTGVFSQISTLQASRRRSSIYTKR